MGVAGSHLTRYIRRFNVIDRTERVLNKDKPIPAPLHKADAERVKKFKGNTMVHYYWWNSIDVRSYV